MKMLSIMLILYFFFNDTATTEIYTLSLHDALPIYEADREPGVREHGSRLHAGARPGARRHDAEHARGEALHRGRSEEHTSELQSRQYLVCRLLLEKKKTTYTNRSYSTKRTNCS